MKRAVLMAMATLVFVWLVPRPEAAAYKCILTNSCTPPPCEFWAALKISLASQNAVFKARAPRNNSRAAERKMWREINAELRKPTFQYTPCAPTDKPEFVISEAPACEVVLEDAAGNLRLGGLDDALRASTGCSEVVAAAFAAAKEEQDNCRFFAQQPSLSLAQQRANAFVEFEAQTESLKNSLLQYLGSCVPDADTEREITESGLDALKQQGEQARNAWEATRAETAAGK
jgi:hypothetical protein